MVPCSLGRGHQAHISPAPCKPYCSETVAADKSEILPTLLEGLCDLETIIYAELGASPITGFGELISAGFACHSPQVEHDNRGLFQGVRGLKT